MGSETCACETGLDIDVGDLLLVWETLAPDGSRHLVNLCFGGTVRGGTLHTNGDDRLREARFVTLPELTTLTMHPPLAAPIKDAVNGHRGVIFLGPQWTE